MSERIRIDVDISLKECLEDLRKRLATNVKRKFNLEEITVNGTMTSKVMAAKYSKKKQIEFHIRKCGLNKGVIELI